MDIKTFTPYRFLLSLGEHLCVNWMPDKIYLGLLYMFRMRRMINWKNPQAYTEKLQWLKLNDRNPNYVKYVDKFAVREYISKTIGHRYLIPLIGCYDSYDAIDFSTLPQQFVLKCTHGSHCSIICRDKNEFDFSKNSDKFVKWMKYNYYWPYREWPYKKVKPAIICEKLMTDDDGNVPTDYKVFCFNGKAKFIKLDLGRYTNHRRVFMDVEWNRYEFGWGKIAEEIPEKPHILDEMIAMSNIVAADMPHARIDWYIIKDKLYFGEITLFDAGGFDKFESYEKDLHVGSLIRL